MDLPIGDHGEAVAEARLVGAAVEGTVFSAAVASTVVLRLAERGDQLEPWATVGTSIAAMAAAQGMVIVVSADGYVTGLAPSDAAEVFGTAAVVDAAEALADQGGVWVLSADRRSLAHVDLVGHVGRRLPVDEVDHIGAAGQGVWYTARYDSLLRFVATEEDGDLQTDLAVAATHRGGLTTCGNAVWVSVAGGLLWCPEKNGEVRQMAGIPGGPVANLICVGTALIGGDQLDRLFMLDFAADDTLRPLPTGRTGRVDALVTDGRAGWALTRVEGAPVAVRLHRRLRAGQE